MNKSSLIPIMPWSAAHQWQLKPSALLMISLATILMGIGEGLLVTSRLGSSPWTVFSQGIALQTGASIGVVVAIISVIVLLLWIPLKLRFGLGTVLNVFFIALFIDLCRSIQYDVCRYPIIWNQHYILSFLLPRGRASGWINGRDLSEIRLACRRSTYGA